jgi:allantoicase
VNDNAVRQGAGEGEMELASRLLGATVVAASDESFGEKEHLLDPSPVSFEPGHYGPHGEIVDGWETRRRRQPGNDWAIVRLGLSGRITTVDVDTSSFTGNFPPECAVEACGLEGYPGPAELSDPAVEWQQIVPRSPLRGDDHNQFAVTDPQCFTHVRLSAFPDGGIARLRILGEAIPDPRQVDGLTIDLAGRHHGGLVVASSDGFYGAASTINRPDEARTMGEGWESRRRRDDGHDHAVIRLGLLGTVRQAIVDTREFRYNASAAVALWSHDAESCPAFDGPGWVPLLPVTALQPDTRHVFEVLEAGPIGWVRIDAFPDGGLARLRLIGPVDPAARTRAGYRWFNALPDGHALAALQLAGASLDDAVAVVRARPLTDAWERDLAPELTGATGSVLARILEGAR